METNKDPISKKINFQYFILALIFLFIGFYVGHNKLLEPKKAPQKNEIYQQEAITTAVEVAQEAYFNNVTSKLPQNPTEARAICQSTGTTIVSGEPTNCPDPVFTWIGADNNNSGTKIDGYLVYWYESTDPPPQTVVSGNTVTYNEVKPPLAVRSAEFKPWPIDLTPNTVYHLMVQTQTDAQGTLAQTGGEVIDQTNNIIQNADVLFVYDYRP